MPAPPGIAMVAPPTVPRNAERAQSEEPEPRTRGLWELRPYEEAGAPSTGGWVVPAPPGVVMVALPEVPRNAESVRSERPRWKWGSKSAAKGIIEAGVLRASGPEQRRYSSLASRAESSCTCLYSSSLARRSSSS